MEREQWWFASSCVSQDVNKTCHPRQKLVMKLVSPHNNLIWMKKPHKMNCYNSYINWMTITRSMEFLYRSEEMRITMQGSTCKDADATITNMTDVIILFMFMHDVASASTPFSYQFWYHHCCHWSIQRCRWIMSCQCWYVRGADIILMSCHAYLLMLHRCVPSPRRWCDVTWSLRVSDLVHAAGCHGTVTAT